MQKKKTEEKKKENRRSQRSRSRTSEPLNSNFTLKYNQLVLLDSVIYVKLFSTNNGAFSIIAMQMTERNYKVRHLVIIN